MKRLLFLFTFLILFVASQVFAEEWEVIETPFVTIGSVPMDEEHVQIFDDIIVEFLDGAWETEKTFPDGDSYVQKLEGIKLVRIDALPNNVERYVTYLTFEVRRYSKEYAQYTEELLLQPLYLDIDASTKKLVRATAFETIEMSNILLKKGI